MYQTRPWYPLGNFYTKLGAENYQAARNHTEDMYDRDFVGHDSPTDTLGERISYVTENGHILATKVMFKP